MLKTTHNGTELLHRHLWEIVQDEAQRANERERFWRKSALVAMVFAFHTVEAYLNFIGERLAPDVWRNERGFFKKEPYRGFAGKFKKVAELVGLPWTPDRGLLKSVLGLKDLRDLIAHGRSEHWQFEEIHAMGTESSYPLSTLTKLVVPKEKMATALRDVEALLNQMHTLAAPKVDGEVWFGVEALQGPVSYNDRHTTMVE